MEPQYGKWCWRIQFFSSSRVSGWGRSQDDACELVPFSQLKNSDSVPMKYQICLEVLFIPLVLCFSFSLGQFIESLKYQSFPHLAVSYSKSDTLFILWIQIGQHSSWDVPNELCRETAKFQSSSASSCCITLELYWISPSFSFLIEIIKLKVL